MSINRIMDISKGALAANQMGLSTTSHNISNANTEGYSRQRVEFQANTPVTVGRAQVGTGVNVGSVTRAASKFLNFRMSQENSKLGRAQGTSDIVDQVESMVSDEGQTGITAKITQFYNDLRSLSAQPDAAPLRSAVRESANAMATRFSTMRKSMTDISKDIDARLEGAVSDINGMLEEVAQLNKKIINVEVNKGMFANDERDRRDLLLRNLAKELPIEVTETENGSVTVSSGRAGVLVSLGDAFKLTTLKDQDADGAPRIQIFTLD